MTQRQICAVLLCMLCMSLACAAPDALPQFELSIRAGLALDDALQELAHQTGMQLVFLSQIAAGRSAPELTGKYTLEAAMTRLLEGSDLTFRQVNEHTVEVRQAPPPSARLPLEARHSTPTPASHDPLEEVLVVAKAEQLVATRIPTPLREIPQSVSVISSEQIRQQNSVDLADIMLNTPGLAVRRTSSIDESAYSRAHVVTSYHVDGGGALKPTINDRILYQPGSNPDLSEFDRVEVLRGSDALFAGNSYPGGTVSLVRKRPLPTPSFAMSATLGSWNNYRIELDGTGPLTHDGALRGRADVVYATRDYFFDRAHLDRKKVFAVVEYDLASSSTLTVGGSYQWDDAVPVFASAAPLMDPHLPRSTGLTFDWAFYNTRIGEVYLQYQQHLADDWTLKLNTSATRTVVDYAQGEFGTLGTLHWLISPNAQFSLRPNRFTLGTMDVTLTGKLDWFGLREVIAVGGDFTRVRGRQPTQGYIGFGPPLTNIAAFDPQAYPDPRGTIAKQSAVDSEDVLEQYGGFVSLQVDVNDALSLTGGARVGSDTYRNHASAWSGGVYVLSAPYELSSSHVVQPYAAFMYRINDHLSWYASYADIYRTQFVPYAHSDGTPLGPQHGVTFESGIKGVWREGALNGSLAVYRIEQRHVAAMTDEPRTSRYCCFRSRTGLSRGVELEVDGELAQGWLIGSGYTYNLYETGNGAFPVTSTPRHLLKIWMSATLPGAFSRWTVGGSLRAQTNARGIQVYKCGAPDEDCVLREVAYTRPYAVLDLRTGFELDKNWQLALSVGNVLDKRYYLSQNTPAEGLWFGEPRNFMLRLDARF